MDRRDALKKLGMGGATVVGASMVISSPALADGGSVTSRPTVPTPTFNFPTTNLPNVGTYTFPAANCTYSSPGPATARIDYSIRATGGTVTPSQAAGTYEIGLTGGNPSGVTTQDLSVDITGGGGGGTVTVTIDVRYVCREPGGTSPGVPAWRCSSWTHAFSRSGSTLTPAANLVPATITDTNCGTPT
jgi:hypothetical protein